MQKLVAALFRPASHDQRGVDAAETKGIRQADVEAVGYGLVGRVVELALGVNVLKVDGGRKHLVLQGQHCNAGFEAAGAAKQMSMHGLCSGDLELVAGGVFAEDQLDGPRLVAVACWG